MSATKITPSLTFSTRQVFREAWEIVKAKWMFLLGFWALVFGVSMVGEMINMSLADTEGVWVTLSTLATQVLGLIIGIGTIKVMLKVTRNKTAEVSELFTNTLPYLWQYFLLNLVLMLVVVFGLILLIVPGVIWAIKYMFAPYALVDKKLSFSEAMSWSDKLTQGIKWQLFGFGLASVGLNLVGLLLLGIGLAVTLPVSTLAGYVLYEQLNKQLMAQKA